MVVGDALAVRDGENRPGVVLGEGGSGVIVPVAVAEGSTVPDAVDVAVLLLVAVAVPLPAKVALCVIVEVEEVVADVVNVTEPVELGFMEPEAVAEAVHDAVLVEVALSELLAVFVAVPDHVPVEVAVSVPVADPLAVEDGVRISELVAVTVEDSVAVDEMEGLQPSDGVPVDVCITKTRKGNGQKETWRPEIVIAFASFSLRDRETQDSQTTLSE